MVQDPYEQVLNVTADHPAAIAPTSGDGAFIAPPLETERPKLAQGAIAAMAVATVAAAIWVLIVSLTGYQIGLAAAAVGWLVGLAAVRASGASDVRLQLIAVAATLAALAASEYFVVRALFVQSLGDLDVHIPLFLSAGDMFGVVKASIADDPVTLFFWALGAYGAYRVTRPAPELPPFEVEA